MPGYNPHFDIDFRRGQVGEKLVGSFLEAVTGSLIEVKTDHRADETGNVYIETWQEGRDGWKTSGINLSDSDFYALAGPTAAGFICIRTDELKRLALSSPSRTIATANINTVNTRGRLVPVQAIVSAIFRNPN